jgi:Acetyltransferase (GNAT) family
MAFSAKIRLATLTDVDVVTQLWLAFAHEKASKDPAVSLKQDFDFHAYVRHHLSKDNTYCFVLEKTEGGAKPEEASLPEMIGFLCTYTYTEPIEAKFLPMTPFSPRKLGMILAFYIQPAHRQLKHMHLLIQSAIDKAHELQVSDLELLIPHGSDTNNLIERLGFQKIATQYTKHLLGGIYPKLPVQEQQIADNAIPLRDLDSNELVRDVHGQVIYLNALHNEAGETLLDSNGLPIYPLPMRDPESLQWIFNPDGTLAVCPPLLNEYKKIVEVNGITQYCAPVYEINGDKVQIKRDSQGNCLFEQGS